MCKMTKFHICLSELPESALRGIRARDGEAASAADMLELPAGTGVIYVVALGYPAESPVSEDAAAGEPVRYYLDDEDRLHVPKFTVDALTVWR